jgi:putative DNA primase/helicase
MLEPIEQFRSAMEARGLVPPVELLSDGGLHRCNVEGRGGDSDGAYLLHLDGVPAGGFENWKDGLGWENWRVDLGRAMSPDEEKAHRAHVEAMRKARETEDRLRKTEARERARKVWESALPCTGHPYLTRKGIKPFGVRIASSGIHDGELVIPMRDTEGKLHSLQFIGTDGGKLFLPGGRKKGCYFGIGKPAGTLYIAEGFATAASIHEATGQAVAVAFDAGNLPSVAQALHAKFPKLDLTLCADDDYRTDGNPGITKATEAAQAVGGRIVVPIFNHDRPMGATDFNDLHTAEGLEAVRICFQSPAVTVEPEAYAMEWLDPQPLTSQVLPLPYPVGMLPPVMRAAVEEVQGFVQAPMPLVASSALGALSLAAQAHGDVQRAEGLTGPVGVFLLTIADSGERKSTCDGFFTKPIRDYEARKLEEAKPMLQDYQAAIEVWEAKRNGNKDLIRSQAKGGEDTHEAEGILRELEHEKPEAPRVPRLIYGDATPESLKWNLAKTWPSGGVVSSEAGIVFGSHGMGTDSVMRNLATLNTLWDGTAIQTERRTSECFTVQGARLTIALQIQEATLRSFFDKSGELARGSGFLARFLVAWPESTQGTRAFREAPATWPKLGAFNRRITEILAQEVSIDQAGALVLPTLALSVDAKNAWVAFHDRIEGELSSGGTLYDVRDVASKIADNAARIAALFHLLIGGGGAIGADTLKAACTVAEWHLNEARRFFGELALPAGLANAARLEAWLVMRCRQTGTERIPTQDVQQYGPAGLREKIAIDAAMQELEELGRAQRLREGRRKFLALNPKITRRRCPATAIPAIPAIPAIQPLGTPRNSSKNSDNSSSKPSVPGDSPVILPMVSGADWDNSRPVEV